MFKNPPNPWRADADAGDPRERAEAGEAEGHGPRAEDRRHRQGSSSRTSCSTGTSNRPTKFMAPGYIQHNPNVPTGRDGFVEFFTRAGSLRPIKKEWKREPELILTSGDLALYVMKRFLKGSRRPDKIYKWNWFDMVRVDNGLVQEHWDMATKPGQMQPAPMQVPMPAGFKEYR